MTALFIGVVSHEGSRFAVSQGPDGLGEQLARALRDRGTDVTVQVNTADLHDPAAVPVSSRTVQESLTEQLHLDRRWAAYLAGSRGPAWWAQHGLRWMRRLDQSIRRPDPRMVERLLNIEFSHLDLLRTGLSSGATWVLVLEDDAASMDVDDCAAGLLGLMANAPQPAFVNVSESFTPAQLGIEHLLSEMPGTTWAGSVDRHVLGASRPVTNTVCAILYRSSFVTRLLAAWDALPLEPVVPIDWKLNLVLMGLFESGECGPGDCWQVDPGPIDQQSMHAEAAP